MKGQGHGHGEKKSRKTEQFIAALLSHPSIEGAAKAVGIGDVTAWRWMQDPEFAEQYRKARREVMRHVTANLQDAARESVECLRKIQLTGENEGARVSAARCILDMALRGVEIEDLAERVDALEKGIVERRQ